MSNYVFKNLFLLNVLIAYNSVQTSGLAISTLIQQEKLYKPIEQLRVGDLVISPTKHEYNILCPIIKISNYQADHYVKIVFDNGTIISTSADQLFYSVEKDNWIIAAALTSDAKLLCQNNFWVTVSSVELVHQTIAIHTLIVDKNHLFCITDCNIIVHNGERIPPLGAAMAVVSGATIPMVTLAFDGTALLSVAPIATVPVIGQAIAGAIIAGIGLYSIIKNNKRKKQTLADIRNELNSNSSSPKKPDDEDDKEKHPYGKYENAPYHHKNSAGTKSKSPKNGQLALDNSIMVKATNPTLRISICNDEIVILRQTSENLYHGYVTTWEELLSRGSASRNIRKALISNKFISKTGKIIKNMI